ncbi:MAG: SEC-C metal-binding domain-containing protein [Dermatophilaceae bacterium]
MLGAMAGAPSIPGGGPATPGAASTESETESLAEGETESWSGAGATTAPGASATRPQVEVSGVGVERPRHAALRYSAPTETGEVEQRDGGSSQRVPGLTDEQRALTPKNAPCPCGSGKKFKMCHGRR